MTTIVGVFRATALGAALAAAQLGAQRNPNTELHAAVGAAIAGGALGAHGSAGLSALAGFGVKSPDNPAGLRVEGVLQYFPSGGGRTCGFGTPCDGNPMVAGVNLDATLDMTGTPPEKPTATTYFVGGVGYYWTQVLEPVVTPGGLSAELSSSSGVGWNGGIGFRVPLPSGWWYVEVRYYGVPSQSGNAYAIPIMIGVQW
ncbi:MAG: hypothetical protein ACYCVE_02310 [Gemmatimonadaceae bacterium]